MFSCLINCDSSNCILSLPLIFSAGNEISGIPDGLCSQGGWMHGEVAEFNCDAILCPPNKYSKYGRQADGSSGCDDCPPGSTTPFFGSFECLNAEDQQSRDERRILEDLYLAAGGDHWSSNNNWLDPDTSVCSWSGISCTLDDDEAVESIHLSQNGLAGTIPTTIFELPRL